MVVAVIMTVFNRNLKTLSCLEAFEKQSLPSGYELEVFVVDDGSTDGTTDAIKKKFPKTHVICGDGSLYWNRGMNLAWHEASNRKPDMYLWLNDDTILVDNCISCLIQTSMLKMHSSIIVGTTSCDEKHMDILTYGGRILNSFREVIRPSKEEPLPCDIFNGNIVLIPKKVFEKVGYNDPYYRHSFGDFDYGVMAQQKGVLSFVAPGVLGYCCRNNPVPLFQRKCYSIKQRFRYLYSPLGMNPFEDFHYQIKFRNVIYCVAHFIKLHINVFLAKDHKVYE